MSNPLRILVVDDDDIDRMAVRRILTSSGLDFILTEATDGQSGLELLRQGGLDCALLDLHLPDRAGLSWVQEARRESLRLPVVVLTGHGSEDIAVELMKEGAADYLPKASLTADRLCQSIQHALRLADLEAKARAADEALRRSEARFRVLVEAITVIIWWTDGEGAIVRECASWGAFTGQSFEEYQGWGWLKAVHPEDQALVSTLWRHSLAFRTPYECTYRLRRADGVYRYTRCQGTPVLRSDGTLEEWVASNSDVTEDRIREEDARHRAEFEQQLIGIVSHDLRNPLSAIAMGVHVLNRTPDLSEIARKTVDRISSSTNRATRMIGDLLDFTLARLGRGIPIVPLPADLHEIAQGAIEETQAANPGCQFVLEQEGDGQGEWDAERIAQILSNLLTNACKYGDRSRPIRVSSRVREEDVELEVHNWGNPIPPELLPELFKPYRVGWQSRATIKSSLGLGLYIVNEIVRSHGGGIRVQSTLEEGTRFSIVLPRQLSSPEQVPMQGQGQGQGQAD